MSSIILLLEPIPPHGMSHSSFIVRKRYNTIANYRVDIAKNCFVHDVIARLKIWNGTHMFICM